MRSWSIPVGRLFGVDVRIHLTFFILALFFFWTDYAAHPGEATGPRDLAAPMNGDTCWLHAAPASFPKP